MSGEPSVEKWILEITGASSCQEEETIQRLWSGYGSILRYGVDHAALNSVIVKHVSPPSAASHPRGWNTDLSHQRKLKSYQVESCWYGDYASRCDGSCRLPACYGVIRSGKEMVILLEDLDAAGFSARRTEVDERELHACLKWLAAFHATFLGGASEGIWECGTYWHLETRPDELARLASEDPALYAAAETIDEKLSASPYQTLVHGDAKLANFCFSPDGSSVAAVDFQYVGRGCGMKDVAYFIGSCFHDEECERQAPILLDYYFNALREALQRRAIKVDHDSLEANWRALFPLAWADFHRFLKGWSPGHWKIHSYSERLTQEVLHTL